MNIPFLKEDGLRPGQVEQVTPFVRRVVCGNPGPFTYRGTILLPVQGWTTHHSIVEVDGRWRLFFHDTQLSNRNNLRSAKVLDLTHEADGAIRTLDPFIREP